MVRAASHCTHIVYASAHLEPKNYRLRPPVRFANPKSLKSRYPHLKILLSLGGDKDANDKHEPLKYIHLLESARDKQQLFINKTIEYLTSMGFNGLDLAFPFPREKPREGRSVSMFLNDVATMWTNTEKDVYKRQYTQFVGELKEAFVKVNLTLTMTVLPNVNSTCKYKGLT